MSSEALLDPETGVAASLVAWGCRPPMPLDNTIAGLTLTSFPAAAKAVSNGKPALSRFRRLLSSLNKYRNVVQRLSFLFPLAAFETLSLSEMASDVGPGPASAFISDDTAGDMWDVFGGEP